MKFKFTMTRTVICISLLLFCANTTFSQVTDLIPIKVDSLWGYCNQKKEIVIKPIYNRVTPFKNGYAVVHRNEKGTVIDKTGKEIIPLKYEIVFLENEKLIGVGGYGCVRGYIDYNGNEIVPPIYNQGKVYKDKIICCNNSTYYFFDFKGKLLSKYECDPSQWERMAIDFGSHMYGEAVRVIKNKKYGLLRYDGKEILPPVYDYVDDYYGQRYDIVQKDNKYCVFDRDSAKITFKELDSVSRISRREFGNDTAMAMKDGKWGIVKFSGEIMIPFIYDGLHQFYFGPDKYYYKAIKNGKLGIINIKGETLIPFNYSTSEINNGYVVDYSNRDTATGWISITMDGKIGMVDTLCREKIASIYDWPEGIHFQDGYAFVKRDHKAGVINRQGKEIIPCKYHRLGRIENGIVAVWSDNESEREPIGYVDINGKEYFYEQH